MEEKIKQAIENIAKNLEVHKEYIRFDNTEQIYIIEDYLDNKIIEIKKDIKFDNLMDYPLKFSYCNFLETVIGWNKTFKEKIIFKEVVFCKVVNFSFSIFDKNINFSNVKFEDKLYFEKCQFKEKFEFFGINNLKVEFNNSLFEKEVYFGKEINDKNIEKSNSFGSCSFEYANFSNCYFKNEVYFKNNEFKQVFFRNSKFNDNVYFNNSVFKDYTDFHECEFEKTACFYGVRFDKAPNFSACYFKEPKAVNLINVDIDKLDFKSLEQYIKDKYQDETCENKQEITEEQRNNNCKLKCAKHLKDSFRVIKDILITQNNTLEAQEWHKLELYAKEKELLFEVESCYKEKNKPFIAAKSEDKNSINLTFSVLLLWIYRVTSLHHTNLPRIINFASLNIVAFGGLVCLITYLSYHINKQSNFWLFGVLILFALIIGIVSLLLKKQKLKNITLILCLFLAFLLALFLMQRIAFLSSFGDIIFALLFYCLLVIVLIYLYPYINLKSFISYCFNWLVYFFLVMIVVIKPQLINPFAGIFSSDKLYESQFEKSLNDLNVSAIMILTDISQDNFNLPSKDQNISFVELNSAKALIIANKEKLKEILSKVYNDKYVSDYKKVLNELENNTSNVKNIIEEIDNKNNNSVISVQLNQILNFNFSQEIDILYMIKSNFFISEKLSPEQMAIFDQKDSQDKLKSVLALLKFKSSFEGILKIINQDEITENTIKSTSVLYSIMLLLCIFSLQKTARKNSIVPS
ncbi:pentapeptide repeat-containing protein [Campylobacter jejuni]|nr:pentapeptide repeat-containing protein [Campylobacter jejuni]ECK8130307.1 pentapeptide repeat-containing protein [Campylobacter jejuni]ECL1033698.1 pentapeptide repeat-containing protein [Campylobacter jejuni]ECL2597123.1 pentapeptide repeat-containing protein [Campylobacter jejuni]ECL3142202.1 pentapeptide repeat-containing protein [Campylobacter jejuni]